MKKTIAKKWILEGQASDLLKKNRDGPLVVDLLNSRDAERRDKRQQGILARNEEAASAYICTQHTESSEQIMLRKERKDQLERALVDVFAHFSSDVAASRILVECCVKAVPFRQTQTLMANCHLSEQEVTTAKERLRYFGKSHHIDSFEDFLADLEGDK